MTPRTLLLAGLTALTLATPAAAERVWTEHYGNWTVALEAMDDGAPLCSWRTRLVNGAGSHSGLVQFALRPDAPVVVSVVLEHAAAPDVMSGGALLVVGGANYPLALRETTASKTNRVTGAALMVEDIRPFLEHFALAARALLVMPSGDQITLNLRGTRASLSGMARCMEQAQALNQAGPRVAPVREKRT